MTSRALREADANTFVEHYRDLPLTRQQLRYMHRHLWELGGRHTTSVRPMYKLSAYSIGLFGGESLWETVDEFCLNSDRATPSLWSDAYQEIRKVDELVGFVAALPAKR